MEAVGKRPSIDIKHPKLPFMHSQEKLNTYCLDLSGDSLHKRGYRRYTTDAPIKENLAAAILQKPSPWKKTLFFLTQCVVQGRLIIEVFDHADSTVHPV